MRHFLGISKHCDPHQSLENNSLKSAKTLWSPILVVFQGSSSFNCFGGPKTISVIVVAPVSNLSGQIAKSYAKKQL